MRNVMRLILAASLGVSLAQLPTSAADTNTPSSFKDDREKASYAIGMYFGGMVKRSSMDLDLDVVIAALKATISSNDTKLPEAQVQAVIRDYQKAQQMKLAEKNKKEGDAFLAANKTKPGVKTHTVTLPDGTTAEMQYKVITEGTGPIPKSNDMVNVNYKGTLINGKEFEDSSKRGGGQPAKFSLNGVVRGWTEALGMMKTGSKYEIYLPSSLAYGDNGRPGIDPGSTLIFQMELVSAEAPPPPPPPQQPLTSDIIKVPSAEELKKGAKIEVIKPEEAARLAAQEAAKQSETNKPDKK